MTIKTLKELFDCRENPFFSKSRHEPHNVDSIMASDLDYYRILRLHGLDRKSVV